MTTAKKTATKSKQSDQAPRLKTTPVGKVKTHRSFVIYGRSGSGKTTLASTFPTPMLYVNVRDNGTDSIADVEGIEVYDIEDVDDIEELRLFLMKDKGKSYKTLVIDTMSQLQEIYVEEVGNRKEKKKDKKPGEWGSMTKQDWGEVASEMKALVIELRDLPMEVVFIAQDRTFSSDDDEAGSNQLMPEIGPRLMPSVAGVMNAAVSVVGCTFVRRKITTKKSEKSNKKIQTEKIVYCLRLGPNPVFVTKVRKPRSTEAPDFIEDPTYDDIIAVIEGDY